MNADQVVEGIGKAVAGVKSAQEYCSLGIEICLTQSEWTAWFQAIGSVVGIGVAILVPYMQHRHMKKKQVVEAVLHAITTSEHLNALSRRLKGIQESSEGLMLRIPHFPDLPTAFREISLVQYPQLTEQTGLTPVGMGYFRKASTAAERISDLLRLVDECFEASPQNQNYFLDKASCAAGVAAKACNEAREELQRFIAKNGI